MKTICTYLILALLFGFASCEDKDDILERVIVKGRVYDDINQQPVKNLLVFIYDVECKNFACHSNKVLDSTRTNFNGYYEINYKPKNGNSLYVMCGYPSRTYAHPENQDWQKQIGRGNNYANFTLRKTSVLRTRVIVTNNPFPPLKVADNIESHWVEIYGANKDTVIYLRGVANHSNPISLFVTTPDFTTYYRQRVDYIQLGAYADTLDLLIRADPNTFPITKYY